MRFTVTHVTPDPNGADLTTSYYNGSYSIENGTLTVTRDDEDDLIVFSPTYWVRVDAPKPRSAYEDGHGATFV